MSLSKLFLNFFIASISACTIGAFLAIDQTRKINDIEERVKVMMSATAQAPVIISNSKEYSGQNTSYVAEMAATAPPVDKKKKNSQQQQPAAIESGNQEPTGIKENAPSGDDISKPPVQGAGLPPEKAEDSTDYVREVNLIAPKIKGQARALVEVKNQSQIDSISRIFLSALKGKTLPKNFIPSDLKILIISTKSIGYDNGTPPTKLIQTQVEINGRQMNLKGVLETFGNERYIFMDIKKGLLIEGYNNIVVRNSDNAPRSYPLKISNIEEQIAIIPKQ